MIEFWKLEVLITSCTFPWQGHEWFQRGLPEGVNAMNDYYLAATSENAFGHQSMQVSTDANAGDSKTCMAADASVKWYKPPVCSKLGIVTRREG